MYVSVQRLPHYHSILCLTVIRINSDAHQVKPKPSTTKYNIVTPKLTCSQTALSITSVCVSLSFGFLKRFKIGCQTLVQVFGSHVYRYFLKQTFFYAFWPSIHNALTAI